MSRRSPPKKSRTVSVPFPQTPESAAAWLKAHGVAVAQIARDHDIPYSILVDLLRNRLQGNYGKAHEGAIVLGLKAKLEDAQ